MKRCDGRRRTAQGLEHLELERASRRSSSKACSSARTRAAIGFIYRIECDAQWRVTRVVDQARGRRTLELPRSDTHGNWTDGNGEPRDDLEGCIDMDISATPFTNTLPIRRLQLEQDERRVIPRRLYRVARNDAKRVEQAYTCIEPDRRIATKASRRNTRPKFPSTKTVS